MTKEELFQKLVIACKLYDDTRFEYRVLLKSRKALRETLQNGLAIRQIKLDKLHAEQDRLLAEKVSGYGRLLTEKQAEYDHLLAKKEAELEIIKNG